MFTKLGLSPLKTLPSAPRGTKSISETGRRLSPLKTLPSAPRGTLSIELVRASSPRLADASPQRSGKSRSSAKNKKPPGTADAVWEAFERCARRSHGRRPGRSHGYAWTARTGSSQCVRVLDPPVKVDSMCAILPLFKYLLHYITRERGCQGKNEKKRKVFLQYILLIRHTPKGCRVVRGYALARTVCGYKKRRVPVQHPKGVPRSALLRESTHDVCPAVRGYALARTVCGYKKKAGSYPTKKQESADVGLFQPMA